MFIRTARQLRLIRTALLYNGIFINERAVNRLKRRAKDISLSDDELKELLEDALDCVIDYVNNPNPPLCVRSAVNEIAYLMLLQSTAESNAENGNIKSYTYSEGDVSESVSYTTPEEFNEKISSLITTRLNSLNHLRVVRYGIPNENT